MRGIWLYTSIGTVLLFVFSKEAYHLWIGDNIAIPVWLSLSMTFYAILNNWQGIYAYALNGIGKLRLQLICIVSAGILNIPLSIVLIKIMGITGTVVSNVILALIMNILYTRQTKLIIDHKAKGIWNR
jgi:O-antigen/teichoic acid export membrane protein